MKRCNYNDNPEYIENENIDKFMNEINELFKKYNLSIAHEDCGGAFLIQEFDKTNINWFNDAYIDIPIDKLK